MVWKLQIRKYYILFFKWKGHKKHHPLKPNIN